MFCPQCGHSNPDAAKFCEKCGARLVTPATTPPLPPQFNEPAAETTATTPPMPPSMPASTRIATPVVEPTAKKKGISKRILTIAAIIAAVVVVAILAVLLLPKIFGGGGSKLLVADVDKSGEYDIYLVDRLGLDLDRAQILAEEVILGNSYLQVMDTDTGLYKNLGEDVAFVPGSNFALLSYDEKDDTVIYFQKANGREATELIDSDGQHTVVYSFDGSDHLGIYERGEDSGYCYFSDGGREAERAVKGENCRFTMNGKLAYAYSVEDESMYVVFSDGKDEIEFEDTSGYPSVSFDGKYLAYVEQGSREQTLYLYNRRNEDTVEVAEGDDFKSRGFLMNSDVAYAVVVDDDEYVLYTSADEDPIAEGDYISVASSPNGKYLIYAIRDEDNEVTLFSYNVSSARTNEIINDDDLKFTIDAEANLILISQYDDEEYTLYKASMDGKNISELLNIDDVTNANVLASNNGSNQHLISLRSEDGYSIYFFKPGDKEATLVLEEWAAIDIKDFNDNVFIFTGVEDEGDDNLLYSAEITEDTEPVEIDDSEDGVFKAVLSANGKSVIYSARTGGDSDDFEVREARVNGDDYDEIYDNAILLDVQWRNMITTDDYWWR